jgi:hypothetical protein
MKLDTSFSRFRCYRHPWQQLRQHSILLGFRQQPEAPVKQTAAQTMGTNRPVMRHQDLSIQCLPKPIPIVGMVKALVICRAAERERRKELERIWPRTNSPSHAIQI